MGGIKGWYRDNSEDFPCSDADHGDPISAPPGPFTIQPEVRGKLLWLTGGPGMGKSTTAQLLGREKGSNQLGVK